MKLPFFLVISFLSQLTVAALAESDVTVPVKRTQKIQTQVISKPAVIETQEMPPVLQSPEEEEARLTKNWGGFRKTLSDKGVDLALIYKGELNSNLKGGVDKHTVYLGNLDFRAALDGEKIAGWRGGSGFLYILGDHGGDPSKHVGDAQVTSNIETPVDTV